MCSWDHDGRQCLPSEFHLPPLTPCLCCAVPQLSQSLQQCQSVSSLCCTQAAGKLGYSSVVCCAVGCRDKRTQQSYGSSRFGVLLVAAGWAKHDVHSPDLAVYWGLSGSSSDRSFLSAVLCLLTVFMRGSCAL